MKADRVLVKVVQDLRRVKNNGSLPLKLRVTYKGHRKYYATPFSATDKEWLEINSPNVKGRLLKIKKEISKIEISAENVIDSINPFSYNAFENCFFKEAEKIQSLKELFLSRIVKLKENNQLGTASSYNDAWSSISKFKEKISLVDISIDFLKEYERWMLKNNKSKATIGIYLRCLRSILNIAIDEKIISKENYPFGNRKYTIPTGKNIKKALSLADIKKVFHFPAAKNTNMQMAKDFWIFSYLCNGINMMDIAYLKGKDLTTETITFERHKTRNTHRTNNPKIVAVRNKKINQIIQKWGCKKLGETDFVFSIISAKDDAETARKKVQQFTKIVNKWMKRIGTALELEIPLTTYVARHSFATILVQNGAPLEFASQSLGHTNITTTQRYFAGFDLDAQKEFTKALTAF